MEKISKVIITVMAKSHLVEKKENGKKEEESNKSRGWENKFPPCPTTRRIIILKFSIGSIINLVMWRKGQQAQVVENYQQHTEEQLFVAIIIQLAIAKKHDL
ncbi:hypothetical protein CR513_38396, partial [Mucuna pruriens]